MGRGGGGSSPIQRRQLTAVELEDVLEEAIISLRIAMACLVMRAQSDDMETTEDTMTACDPQRFDGQWWTICDPLIFVIPLEINHGGNGEYRNFYLHEICTFVWQGSLCLHCLALFLVFVHKNCFLQYV